MPETHSDTHRPRVSLLLLLGAGLVRFVNLGFLDMQAWDEALYAVRAETVSRFGLFLDQSSKAVDGLYSALHPPLYVWLTALSFEVFGVNEFAARFFSALFGALTLFVIYRIGAELRNERTGLIAALLYGLSPIVLFYTRQGQFDATLVFFLTLSVYFLIRSSKTASASHSFAAGLATGAALMTKLFVGLGIPLTMLAWMILAGKVKDRKLWSAFVVLCLGAALVAGPWHVYMTIVHGDGDPLFFLTASSLVERTLSGVEGNVKALGPLYFVNQLFVVFPVGIFWFAHSLPAAFKRSEPSWLVLGLWFAVFFVVFSLMRTQLEVYILPMLVPASLVAGRTLDRAIRQEIKQRTIIVLLAGTAMAAAWSISQDWRNAAKGLIGSLARFTLPSVPDMELLTHLALVILLILAAATVLWKKGNPVFLGQILLPLHFVSLALVAIVSVSYLDQTRYVDGGERLGQFIRDRNIKHVVVAGYERNPQLSYYLAGADLGWASPVTFERIAPPADAGEFKDWLARELTNVASGTLVVLEKDKFLRYKRIIPQLIMPQSFIPVFDSRRYSAWVRRPDDTLASLGEQLTSLRRFTH